MTTQAPRNDVGPDNTIVWEPAHPTEERPAGKRLIWLMVAAVVGGMLVLAGILYVAGYLVTGDKVPKKAQISGVAVGGLSRTEAIQKLSAELGARAAEPLNLTVGEKEAQLKPVDAGLAVDYAKSVDAAGGGKSLNPMRIFKTLTGGSAIDAVVVVDQAKLQAAVGELAKTFNQEPVDAAVGVRRHENQAEAGPGGNGAAAGCSGGDDHKQLLEGDRTHCAAGRYQPTCDHRRRGRQGGRYLRQARDRRLPSKSTSAAPDPSKSALGCSPGRSPSVLKTAHRARTGREEAAAQR